MDRCRLDGNYIFGYVSITDPNVGGINDTNIVNNRMSDDETWKFEVDNVMNNCLIANNNCNFGIFAKAVQNCNFTDNIYGHGASVIEWSFSSDCSFCTFKGNIFYGEIKFNNNTAPAACSFIGNKFNKINKSSGGTHPNNNVVMGSILLNLLEPPAEWDLAEYTGTNM
jgi:hypothetical protein